MYAVRLDDTPNTVSALSAICRARTPQNARHTRQKDTTTNTVQSVQGGCLWWQLAQLFVIVAALISQAHLTWTTTTTPFYQHTLPATEANEMNKSEAPPTYHLNLNNPPKFYIIMVTLVVLCILMVTNTIEPDAGLVPIGMIVGYAVGNGIAARNDQPIEPIIGHGSEKK